MNKGLSIVAGIIILAILLGAAGVVYTVDETQQVIVTQFGKLIGTPKTEAGLYFKFPWWTANYFDKRIMEWDGDADQMPTREKKMIWVDITARWRIIDPLQFMKRIGVEMGAQTLLDDILDGSTRDIISSHILIEAIRDSNRLLEVGELEALENVASVFGKTAIEQVNEGREQLGRKILDRASKSVLDYGIELVDVRIKRVNYVQKVRREVYDRMIEERKRAAEKFRSEGQGKKAEVEGQVVKELKLIQSEAYRQAQEVKGKADAEAIKIYANAFNKDPEFYSFIQTLESYKETITPQTFLILSTDNEFYQQLNGSRIQSSSQ